MERLNIQTRGQCENWDRTKELKRILFLSRGIILIILARAVTLALAFLQIVLTCSWNLSSLSTPFLLSLSFPLIYWKYTGRLKHHKIYNMSSGGGCETCHGLDPESTVSYVMLCMSFTPPFTFTYLRLFIQHLIYSTYQSTCFTQHDLSHMAYA